MIWPVVGPYTVTSTFGWRKKPYGDGAPQFHSGVDLDQPDGSPIMAVLNGRVVDSRFDGCTGNTVTIVSYDTKGPSPVRPVVHFYHHMMDRLVNVGDSVPQGRPIGHLGGTGTCSTGSHLHFGMAQLVDNERASRGTLIDPVAYANGRLVLDERGEQYSLPSFGQPPIARSNPTTPTRSPIKRPVQLASVGSGGSIIILAGLALSALRPSKPTKN